jgi:hypothetical protein
MPEPIKIFQKRYRIRQYILNMKIYKINMKDIMYRVINFIVRPQFTLWVGAETLEEERQDRLALPHEEIRVPPYR